MSDGKFIAAVDQGTGSTRFLILDNASKEPLLYSQEELHTPAPHPGWCEVDALQIWDSVVSCAHRAIAKFKALGHSVSQIQCLGITNQRETCLIWNKETGQPYCPAIVWLDVRTSSIVEHFKKKASDQGLDIFRKTGLILSSYQCCVKLAWMMENVEGLREDVASGRAIAGTIDSWLIWKLTGGAKHVTDVTNASRTCFMDVQTLQWDDQLLDFFSIPKSLLPEIRSSAEVYGLVSGLADLDTIPISGCLGDQQAALVGQQCFGIGEAKNTYGTGLFLLCNTGPQPVFSTHGLLTTVAYQLGPHSKPCYALEGGVASGGSAVRWLRDQLGIISTTEEVEDLARGVESSEGVCFVPAFSGLFTPHWDETARGTICGLTQATDKRHIARATLDAISMQTVDVIRAMNDADQRFSVTALKVDGGASRNNLLMQIQADDLGIPVVRGSNSELTVLGAAIAASIGVGLVREVAPGEHLLPDHQSTMFTPATSAQQRAEKLHTWHRAVQRARGWLSIS